jgi:cbb3-type cytochrome oxidase cytochrome c subunit
VCLGFTVYPFTFFFEISKLLLIKKKRQVVKAQGVPNTKSQVHNTKSQVHKEANAQTGRKRKYRGRNRETQKTKQKGNQETKTSTSTSLPTLNSNYFFLMILL